MKEFTNYFDKNDQEIFDGDLIKGKNGKVWRVKYRNRSNKFYIYCVEWLGKDWEEKMELETYVRLIRKNLGLDISEYVLKIN